MCDETKAAALEPTCEATTERDGGGVMSGNLAFSASVRAAVEAWIDAEPGSQAEKDRASAMADLAVSASFRLTAAGRIFDSEIDHVRAELAEVRAELADAKAMLKALTTANDNAAELSSTAQLQALGALTIGSDHHLQWNRILRDTAEEAWAAKGDHGTNLAALRGAIAARLPHASVEVTEEQDGAPRVHFWRDDAECIVRVEGDQFVVEKAWIVFYRGYRRLDGGVHRIDVSYGPEPDSLPKYKTTPAPGHPTEFKVDLSLGMFRSAASLVSAFKSEVKATSGRAYKQTVKGLLASRHGIY